MNRCELVVGAALFFGCGVPAGSGSVSDGGAQLPVNGRRMALECEARGVRAWDASRTLLSGNGFGCAFHGADRRGRPVSGASALFLVEAGRVTGSAVTNDTGAAEVRYETGLPEPRDVDPGVFTWSPLSVDDPLQTGELLVPTWMVPERWNENPADPATWTTQAFTLREPRRPDPLRLTAQGLRRVNNPRDNLVTMIAVVDGEEGFTDTNDNGVFDPGESFVDLTEPFVDANDNGTFDESEPFVDVNGNRQWDGRNGRWDATTKLWTMERFLWTGVPDAADLAPVVPGVAGHRPTVVIEPGGVDLVCPGTGMTCSQAAPVTARVYVADPWFNALARHGASDTCDASPAETLPVVVAELTPRGARELWPAGDVLGFQLADKRDGTVAAPRRTPGLPFEAQLTCHFTGTPGGARADHVLGTLAGSIE